MRYGATGAAAAGLLSAGAIKLRANPLGLPIGCQAWPVRHLIAKNFPDTIKMLAKAGFQSIELMSPVGWGDSGFAGIGKYSGPEFRRILGDAGVICRSSHFSIEVLRKEQESRIAWAKEIGLTQMIFNSLDGPRNPTMDDVKRLSDEANTMGENAAKAGLQQGLHMEEFELSMVDGQRTYDLLLKFLHPKLVKFQFQIMPAIIRGYNPVTYFTTYPGRFISMHVQSWSAKTRKEVSVGQGTLDWKKIFAAAKVGGIKNYYVEMSLPMMKASVPYLRKLQV